MSKLSLSKLLKDVPGRAPEPLKPHNEPATASREPAPAAESSPLSGWSDGAASPPPAPNNQGQAEPDDFFYDDGVPVLTELYDDIADSDDGGGGGDDNGEETPDAAAAAGSEGEEDCEGWEDDEGDAIEGEEMAAGGGDGEIIDLCDSQADEDPAAPAVVADAEDEEEERREEGSRACHVCGTDLTALHYLQQVQHVKACVSRRGLRDGGAARPPPVPQAPRQQSSVGGRRLLDMDIREWLSDLDLESQAKTFIAEEIDMSLVHSLTEEDLRTLGVVDLLSQRRLLAAARRVGAEVAEAKKAKRAAAKRAASAAAAPPRAKRQQTLRLPGMPALAAAPAPTAPGARSAEQQLLSRLYPSRDVIGAAQLADEGAEPGPTPPLPPAAALPAARVSLGSSLFACAARYEPVADTLEERLERRRAEQPGAVPQALGRGGVIYARPEESTATKLMKLQALRDELRCHEETVAELRRMVAELEAEVGQGAAGGGGGAGAGAAPQ